MIDGVARDHCGSPSIKVGPGTYLIDVTVAQDVGMSRRAADASSRTVVLRFSAATHDDEHRAIHRRWFRTTASERFLLANHLPRRVPDAFGSNAPPELEIKAPVVLLAVPEHSAHDDAVRIGIGLVHGVQGRPYWQQRGDGRRPNRGQIAS
ncbi:MAG: hypothetical protein JNM84_07600 [Planctomycetes bacterium]|nr:hypothetical protein [Planctomycetota bacterium]